MKNNKKTRQTVYVRIDEDNANIYVQYVRI